MTADPHPLGLGKACRRCGARSATLGSVCPACGRPYVPGGLLDRLPFMGSDVATPQYAPHALFALVVLLLGGWVWLLVTDPVMAIVAAGAGFVALVAAIGIANLLAERGR